MELLLFVRDSRPSEAEMLEWLGPSAVGSYHVLRKVGLLLLQDGVVTLNPENLSADGTLFHYHDLTYEPDRGILHHVLRAERPWLNADGTSSA